VIYKFPMTIFKGQVTKFDLARYQSTRKLLADGEWEILIRRKISWDTDQMRKYFHGPVLEMVRDCERAQGRSTSKEQIKIELKTLYGPVEDKVIGTKTIKVLKSTGDYTRAEYKEFLKDINAFCVENYQCELPPAEQVE